MSRKILIVLVVCALSMQALALSCFSCHDRNRGVNCVDRQHEEMVSCSDSVPSQDTNSFLGDYFKIGANTTGTNYVCINVYANFTNGQNISYSGCAFKNSSLTCENLYNNPKENTAILTSSIGKKGPQQANFACKICNSDRCNTNGANSILIHLGVVIFALLLGATL
ncbi:hypothetical protein ACFFRR_002856 [Megaselia abdita]